MSWRMSSGHSDVKSINFVDPFDENESAGEVDEFEEVKAPPTSAE